MVKDESTLALMVRVPPSLVSSRSLQRNIPLWLGHVAKVCMGVLGSVCTECAALLLGHRSCEECVCGLYAMDWWRERSLCLLN